jgi:hypothetical protein
MKMLKSKFYYVKKSIFEKIEWKENLQKINKKTVDNKKIKLDDQVPSFYDFFTTNSFDDKVEVFIDEILPNAINIFLGEDFDEEDDEEDEEEEEEGGKQFTIEDFQEEDE